MGQRQAVESCHAFHPPAAFLFLFATRYKNQKGGVVEASLSQRLFGYGWRSELLYVERFKLRRNEKNGARTGR